ncbi:uncharacterized protein LOC122371148 [Amphibalanus amphitrite]|uniref:uncharacterized protein LOC122371148 n=1 Tax=Amphibalanus amphitrite TaxID=1232801 RepID=UPI001C91F688|nr:uncharacterized protein LOC122371148 [Amphibalanus amphitrite]
MRQKTLTPKKDVKQEARIRLGAEGTMKSELDEQKTPLDVHDISIIVPGINGTTTPTENGDGVTTLPDPRKVNGHQVNNNDQPDAKTNCAGAAGPAAANDGEIEMKKFVSTVPGGGVTSEPPHEGTGCCVLQ